MCRKSWGVETGNHSFVAYMYVGKQLPSEVHFDLACTD